MLNPTKTTESIFKKQWKLLNGFNIKEIENGELPGIYMLGYSPKKLEGQRLTPKEIFYVGMSNSTGGVRSRIKQFCAAIKGKGSHSAGNRFRNNNIISPYNYSDASNACNFYFITETFKCNVVKGSRTPEDLRIMGEICRLEYYLIAYVLKEAHLEPQLNVK